MKSFSPIYIFLFSLMYSSCIILDSDMGCDQNLAGTYVGIEKTYFANGDNAKTVTLIIEGVEGDYTVTSPSGSALDEDDLVQNDCGFEFETGPRGNRRSGQVTIFGDSLHYSTSADNFGVLPSFFEGVRK